MFDKEDLLKIARTTMPFGKYRGRLLADLPEPYLLWFANRGFPDGTLGALMQLTLEIKVNGLEYLLKPLRPAAHKGGENSAQHSKKRPG